VIYRATRCRVGARGTLPGPQLGSPIQADDGHSVSLRPISGSRKPTWSFMAALTGPAAVPILSRRREPVAQPVEQLTFNQ
jgi:hypothetical protein